MQTLIVSRRVEAVDVRDREFIDAIDHGGMAGGDGIEPAAAARASGGRAEFAAHAVQHVGDLRVLGRERPFADAGGVGFHHADDAIHAVRRDAGTGAGAAGGGVGRSDERIRAVIDVEKSSLRAFEENFVAAPDGFVEQTRPCWRRTA